MIFDPSLRVSFLVTLLMTYFLCMTSSAPTDEEVVKLPGLKKAPTFRQYSGYLNAGGGRFLHYWFVEAQSNPKTSPFAVWINGGPGCSSLLGFLTENGPFSIQDDGRTLEYNPNSWNSVSNMLYIESPAGVGFSYSVDKNITTDDDLTAYGNAAAMRDFFRKFPEYSENDLYITGESYGGVYVPMLTVLLAEFNSFRFNIKGYAIGNAVTSYEMLGDSVIYFSYYHGVIGTDQWNDLLRTCCASDANNCKFVATSQINTVCKAEVKKVNDLLSGGYFNQYNLYKPCPGGVVPSQKNFVSRPAVNVLNWIFPERFKNLRGETCVNDSAIITYLNQPTVRQALHIPNNVQKWLNCADDTSSWYTRVYNDTTPFYKRLFNAGIRGILYNGDVDTVCDFLGDEWFADSLERPVLSQRKAWFYFDENQTKQVAGFVKTCDLLTYATVRGSGHMVPTDRPRPALEIFTNLVQNRPFTTS